MEITSEVLKQLQPAELKLMEKQACASCPHAVWHVAGKDALQNYCMLMHSLIDDQITACDGPTK